MLTVVENNLNKKVDGMDSPSYPVYNTEELQNEPAESYDTYQRDCTTAHLVANILSATSFSFTQRKHLPTKDFKAANLLRYKTELCRPFAESGFCKYGQKCQFAHGLNELRNRERHPKYKTKNCRTFHTTGYCPYGLRCHFIHFMEEARPKPRRNKIETPTIIPFIGGSYDNAEATAINYIDPKNINYAAEQFTSGSHASMSYHVAPNDENLDKVESDLTNAGNIKEPKKKDDWRFDFSF